MSKTSKFDDGASTAYMAISPTSEIAGNERAQVGMQRIRKVVLGAAFGTVVEYFDFTVYAFLATTLADVFFPAGDRSLALLYTLGVFAASFLLRPIGGILVGHLGDRYGRRPALTISVVGMACASALIGVLPSYVSFGLFAPISLLLLRCIQGLAAGGELGGAAAYVAEVAPDNRRGFLTSTMQVATVAGTMLGSVCVGVLHLVMSQAEVLAWGWRIPFLFSIPLGLITLILRRRMEESKQFETLEARGAVASVPVIEVFRSHLGAVAKVFGLGLVAFSSYYLVFTYLATYLQRQGVMSAGTAAWSSALTLLLAAIAIPFWGWVSDRVGRRPLLLFVCVANLIVAYPAFLIMSTSAEAAILAQLVLGQIEAIYLGVMLSTFCELFPANVRASGISLGFNLASIVSGGTAPYVATWLISSTGQPHAPAWMLIVSAAISLVTAYRIRETANRPMLIV